MYRPLERRTALGAGISKSVYVLERGDAHVILCMNQRGTFHLRAGQHNRQTPAKTDTLVYHLDRVCCETHSS